MQNREVFPRRARSRFLERSASVSRCFLLASRPKEGAMMSIIWIGALLFMGGVLFMAGTAIFRGG